MDEIIAKLVKISRPYRDSENAGMIHISEVIEVLRSYQPMPDAATVERVAVAIYRLGDDRWNEEESAIQDAFRHMSKAAIAAQQPAPKESSDE